MANDEWTQRVQRETLETATKWGEGWTLADIEFVFAFTDVATDQELAHATGRSLYSVQTIQRMYRDGKRLAALRANANAPRRPWATNATYHGWMEGDGDE